MPVLSVVGTGGVRVLLAADVLPGLGDDSAGVVVLQGAVGFPQDLHQSGRSPGLGNLYCDS